MPCGYPCGMTHESGPWRLVRQLRDWAGATEWCRWLELGGSLGRGAGDELSDVYADIGIAVDPGEARAEAIAAVSRFAPVAASFVQRLGGLDHVMVQYRDGRQLSLVLDPDSERGGLPPGAKALLDRTGALARPGSPAVVTASTEDTREWAFLAWWAIADVAKHARRGSAWRAVEALHEARTMAWRLHAAALGLDYPVFGAVTVVNARRPAPDGLADTLPATPDDARAPRPPSPASSTSSATGTTPTSPACATTP